MPGFILFSFLFGLTAAAFLLCVFVLVRRWHAKELGGDRAQWSSVRALKGRRGR